MTLPDRPISARRRRIATITLISAALLSGCSQAQANSPTPSSQSGVAYLKGDWACGVKVGQPIEEARVQHATVHIADNQAELNVDGQSFNFALTTAGSTVTTHPDGDDMDGMTFALPKTVDYSKLFVVHAAQKSSLWSADIPISISENKATFSPTYRKDKFSFTCTRTSAGASTPAAAPAAGATGSAAVTSLGKDFVPDGWCKYVWDKAGLASFIENGTGDAPADPRGSVDQTADRQAVICSSSGVLITRATFSSPAAAQAALKKYQDSTLSKVHAGEESTVTIDGIRGDYAYVAGTPTLTSFNFGNGIYNGTEFVSVTLVVAGTPPTREVGKAKVDDVVGIASRMQLPQAVAAGGE